MTVDTRHKHRIGEIVERFAGEGGSGFKARCRTKGCEHLFTVYYVGEHECDECEKECAKA